MKDGWTILGDFEPVESRRFVDVDRTAMMLPCHL